MRISEISIKYPLFITMVNFLVFVLGLISFQKLGVDQSPDVDLPYVYLSIEYPGANPATAEEQLLKPVEKVLRSIEGLKQMTGVARNNGISVQMEFELNVKSDQAFLDVRDRMSHVTLPPGVKSPHIDKASNNDISVMSLAVSADNLSPSELMHFVNDNLKPQIQQVPGVGAIYITGYRDPELHVELDQYKINGVNLTPLSISNQIDNQIVTIPAGNLNEVNKVTPMTTYNIPNSISQVENLPIKTKDEKLVRLGDISHINLGLSKQNSYGELNGKPLVILFIYKQSGGNLVQISKDINKKINIIKKTLPSQFHLQVIHENYSFIENSLKAVGEDLFIGALLAVLIVFLFLRDWKSTFIVAVAIPTSLIGTFIMMHLLNFTLNWMTLLALTISIGILVDDAIVVIENIHRHFKMGKNAFQAAYEGTAEIGLAAIAVTFTIVAVFVPVAFMQGIVGRYFIQFGLTVTVAVLISLFVAFTMVPMLSSRIYSNSLPSSFLVNFFQKSENLFSKIQNFYTQLVEKALKVRLKVILISFVILIISVLLLKFVPISNEPSFDNSQAYVNITLEDGTPLNFSIERGKEMAQFIKSYPGVQDVIMRIGAGRNSSMSNIRFTIKLVETKYRNFTQKEFSSRISKELRKFLKSEKEKVNFGGNFKPIQIALFSNNDLLIQNYSTKVSYYMNSVKDVQNASAETDVTYEYRIVPDPMKSAIANVVPSDVANIVKFLFSDDSYVGMYEDKGNLINMRLMIANNNQQNLNNLLGVYVQPQKGNPVLLSSIASVHKVPIDKEIKHINGLKELSVIADYTGNDLAGTTNQIYEFIKKTHPLDVSYQILGDSSELENTMKQVEISLSLAALFVFMVLCSQFGNFVAPLSIMASVPFCFSGTFLALLVTREPLTLYSMIGVILLIGLVVKNAILLIEFAQQKIKSGSSVYDALVESTKIRLRPILMTTLTMIFGMLPMVFSSGDGHEARVNMSISVVGGLISSTLLTLVVVPCIYSLLCQWNFFKIKTS